MKKLTLSLTTIALLSTYANAESLESKIETLNKKIDKLESKHTTQVQAKAIKLKFSGKHYLGFTAKSPETGEFESTFETRRNYFQTKVYFKEDPKSYMRFTYDTNQNNTGEWNVRLKYAYLYLDNVLPNTGVEFGQVHRPWIDYEEHHIWLYRSIHKVFMEADESAHLTNSSDLGINFKTKTPYFSSEIGLFNGEGYHSKDNGKGQSFEWRLTAHPLGTGKKHVKAKDNYLDVSLFGQVNQSLTKSYGTGKNEKKDNQHNLNLFVWAIVYNKPEFLIGAQYVIADNEDYKFQGAGFSINGEFRFMEKYSAIGRYDNWTIDKDEVADLDKDGTKDSYLIGLVYNYNKNVKFIGNMLDVKYADKKSQDFTKYMITAEVNW